MTAKEENKMILSFDYSEIILLPIKQVVPSTFYFKARRKVDLFGICDENSGVQTNFLIDECFKISKGPDSVISMLNFCIETYVQ